MEQLTALESGAVSIAGFATVFSAGIPLEDALQVFNFNRENLARPNLCQIWWMPSSFAERFVRAVPDLNSWFLVRLHLTEVVPYPTETQPEARPLAVPSVRLTANLEDARKRAKDLVNRFERALGAGVSAEELHQNFIAPAVNALLEAGIEKEALELSSTLNQKVAQRNAPTDQQDDENRRSKELWNVPHGRNPFFTGRQSTLYKLRDILTLERRAAISGLGGIGKTQTVVEYAYLYRSEYEVILWAKASSYEALSLDLGAIANLLNLQRKDARDQSLSIVAVKQWLGEHTGWLLILDQADSPQVVGDFLSLNLKGHIILISRASALDSLRILDPIQLDRMSNQEAEEFLLARTGRGSLDTSETEALSKLVHELGCFPLALEQAGAYIHQNHSRFRGYLTDYRKRGLDLLERAKPDPEEYPTYGNILVLGEDIDQLPLPSSPHWDPTTAIFIS